MPCHLIQCVFSFLHQSKPCTNHAHTASREACRLIVGKVFPLDGLTEQVTGANSGKTETVKVKVTITVAAMISLR